MSIMDDKLGGLLVATAVLLLHASCDPVGPDYAKPEVPPPPKWHAEMAEGLQPLVTSDETLAEWWKTLDDPVLQRLVERAMDGNLDLQRAYSVVREARARRGIADTDRFPTVTASGGVGFQRGSDRMGRAANAGLFTSGFDAGWEWDVFGRVRRSIEAADANLEASQELLRDTLVSLLAEVALNYVELRQAQKELQVAESNLKLQTSTFDLVNTRHGAGLTARLDVDQARYNLSDTRSRIPRLRIAAEQAKNRLAVLLGLTPGEVASELDEAGEIPVGPVEVAVGIPAEALRRRPDIRRAERVLAARTALIGVATAEKYPRFSLSGSIGYDAITKGNPLSLGNLVGGLGGNVFHTVFDAGRIRQNIEIQNALQEQALVDYESSILLAVEEVENSLVAYADEQVRRRHLADAEESARQAVEIVQRTYTAGLVDFQRVLDSQRALLSFQQQLAQSDGAVTSHLIRLYKALGGGWSPLPPQSATTNSQGKKQVSRDGR